jgi:Flp pilus assembly protein TadB
LYLRKVRPNDNRPIKVPLFYPITFLIACCFIILMTVITTPVDSFLCLAIIAAGIPVYYLGVKWKKPKSIQKKIGE